MKIISEEKIKAVMKVRNLERTRKQGVLDGEIWRTLGKPLSKFALVGIDAYCLGFKTGYFERQHGKSVSPKGQCILGEVPELIKQKKIS